MKRVVITGLGTVNPLGSTVEKFWENVKKGTLGVSKIDSFDTTELGVSVAGIDTFVEFGPKSVLTGLVKKTLKGVTAKNVENVDTLEGALA